VGISLRGSSPTIFKRGDPGTGQSPFHFEGQFVADFPGLDDDHEPHLTAVRQPGLYVTQKRGIPCDL
jgi:hypothetical protein